MKRPVPILPPLPRVALLAVAAAVACLALLISGGGALAAAVSAGPSAAEASLAPASKPPAPPRAPGKRARPPAAPGEEEDSDEGVDIKGKGDVNLHEDVIVNKGEVRKGDLVVIDGDVEIHGAVHGDVIVVSGSLDIDGRVDGDAVAILSDTTLAEDAVIQGDFVHLGGDLEVAPGAMVHGERFQWDLPTLAGEAAKSAAGGVLRLIYIAKLLVLALIFWVMLIAISVSPRQITAAGEALGKVWGRAILMGLLAYAGFFVLLFIFLVLCLILIGIPLVALLSVAWFATQAVGMAAVLWLLGNRISRNLLRREAAPIVAFLIGFAIYIPTQILPFYLGLPWLVFSLLGRALDTCLSVLAVGLAMVTQFGRVTEFPPRAGARIAGPEPRTPPPAPPYSGSAAQA
jgi:cytoskeletal protein CcmA (bactofilin family)